MEADGQVYLGVWTNWSRGSATLGSTLTMTKRSGNILIAFTAIFIPFVGSRLWKMLCFAFHSCSSKRGAQSAIYYQRQVVLRNSPSADSGLVSLLFLMWAWRRSFVKSLVHLSPLFVFAILFIVVFTLAGGYSSQIASATGDEVLLKGDKCGRPRLDRASDVTSTDVYTQAAWTATKIADAENYAQQCYAGQGSNILDCNRLVAQTLPTVTTDANSGCPFESDICLDNSTNLYLDTGYIDSNDHLGLNAPANQRFLWRQVLSCAPLRTDGYTTKHTTQNTTFVRYHYGTQVFQSNTPVDYTYSVQDLESQYNLTADVDRSTTGLDFRVAAQTSTFFEGRVINGTSDFIPNRALNRTDGDISIVYLSGNGVVFFQESDDAWYRATHVEGRMGSESTNGSSTPYYIPTEAASPLGCVQQYQWCNSEYPTSEGCGPLASWYDALAGAYPLFNMTVDDFVMGESPLSIPERGYRIHWARLITVIQGGIFDVVQKFGPRALESQKSRSAGIQTSLAKNQWQRDVMTWWNTTLAFTQATFVNTALGFTYYPEAAETRILSPPANDQERHFCQSQKIRHVGYTSFSVFGLSFTYIFGALLIAISFALDPLMRCLHNRRQYKQYQYLEWKTNGALQLHRLTQDELGYGKWSGCTDTVPVTQTEDLLTGLDITDLAYPKLCRDLSTSASAVNEEEEIKPKETNNSDSSGASEDDTLRNVDTESSFTYDPQHQPSSTRDVSASSAPVEYQRAEAQRVSVISEEDEGRSQSGLHEMIAENARELNPSR
ncbi:hypothetical protein PG989_001721 [Apiospora arundinis]